MHACVPGSTDCNNQDGNDPVSTNSMMDTYILKSYSFLNGNEWATTIYNNTDDS